MRPLSFNRLSKTLSTLAARVDEKTVLPPRFVFGHTGEDVSKVVGRHLAEHPDDAGRYAFTMITWAIDMPCDELCSAGSVAAALPGVRAHFKNTLTSPGFGPSIYEQARELQSTWRGLAERFGLEYGDDVKEREAQNG